MTWKKHLRLLKNSSVKKKKNSSVRRVILYFYSYQIEFLLSQEFPKYLSSPLITFRVLLLVGFYYIV